MKKLLMFSALLAFGLSSASAAISNNDDPIDQTKTKVKTNNDRDHSNTIYYSSIQGEALFIETVDKHHRPLSCLMRINDETKHHFVAENGMIAFDKNKKVKVIHVFHDSKVYDFVPEVTKHNKLTLVLNTKNQKYDLYENRVRKINNEWWETPEKSGIKIVSCGLQTDMMTYVEY